MPFPPHCANREYPGTQLTPSRPPFHLPSNPQSCFLKPTRYKTRANHGFQPPFHFPTPNGYDYGLLYLFLRFLFTPVPALRINTMGLLVIPAGNPLTR